MARRRDPMTKDLFAWQPPKVAVGYSADVIGRGRLDNKIARQISQALREAREDQRLSRSDIAARMSEYLGRTISEAILNKWAAEGSEDHRIPLDAFVALVDATGAKALLGFVPGEFGLTVIEDEFADLIEAQLLDEHMEEVQARRAALTLRRKARR
jgi:transcriptional regulator with XRE-family HTH domain